MVSVPARRHQVAYAAAHGLSQRRACTLVKVGRSALHYRSRKAEADRDPIAAVAKKHGISEQSIYTWRKKFGTFQADDVKRLRQLESENARLKKLVAERDLEIEVMKEINAKKW